MKITIVYRPADTSQTFTRDLEVADDATIQSILPKFAASSLAHFEFDGIGSGGHIVGSWMEEGPLQSGATYLVCSANIRQTNAIFGVKKRGKK